jgi:glycosyltransferase involved in cell wall biosynthesis
VRVAVYTDAVYGKTTEGYTAEETFVVFASHLRDHFEGLVLVGRTIDDNADRQAGDGSLFENANRSDRSHLLRSDVEVAPLPHYHTLSSPVRVLGSTLASFRRYWRVLDQVDAAWLLGPHPYAVAFALMTLLRRRRLVLGVRQDFPAHQRSRHPGRPLIHALALGLELIWRLLAWRRPVVAVGPDLARRYRHARPALASAVSLITADDVVDADTATAKPYDGVIDLLWVGRLDPEKNPLLLVEVLSLLDDDGIDWRLTVCGDGSLAPELANRVTDAGWSDRVTFSGFTPLDELHHHYRTAHVLVHLSWTEGVPQVLFEAFAAGLPVVATDVGGVRAATAGAAVLVEPGDARAVATAVERIATDVSLRDQLIIDGLEIAATHTGSHQRAAIAELFAAPSNGGGVGRGEPGRGEPGRARTGTGAEASAG